MQTVLNRNWKKFGQLTGALTLVMVIGILYRYWANNKNSHEVEVLEEFVVQAIVDEQLNLAANGYRSPEGAIVAHVDETSEYASFNSPIRIWRYEQGQLADVTQAELLRAVKSEQRADWPPFVYLFSFKVDTSEHVTIDIQTLYNQGLSPNGRGAMGQFGSWKDTVNNGESHIKQPIFLGLGRLGGTYAKTGLTTQARGLALRAAPWRGRWATLIQTPQTKN